jgi:hypothetical protein
MDTLYHYDLQCKHTYKSEATYDQLDGSINIPANTTTLTPLGAVFPDLDVFDITNNCWTIDKYTNPVIPPVIPPTQAELAQQQSNAIDTHIAQQLATLNYDDIGQVAMCCLAGKWQTEAQTVNTWIQLCWNIQANIVAGSVVYPDNQTAIAALPIF